jgi:hypothetical protein
MNYQYASQQKAVRRTFFSFHYGYDVARAHVVRNSWVTKEDREDAGFFDASVFESKQRESADALKNFIIDGLKGSTVTGVLIGNQTAFRPWVRYELVRSFYRGNGLFGVRVHNIKNLQGLVSTAGENPFDRLAYRVADGRVSWQEQNNAWTNYEAVPSMALTDVAYNLQGKHHHTFSTLFPVYDWVDHDGYNNLGTWIERAAQHAGK